MNSKKVLYFINHRGNRASNNFFSLYTMWTLLLIFFLIFPACAVQTTDKKTEPDGKPQTGLITKTISIISENGLVNVEVELAQTDAERSTGLMYRKELEDGKGMLFIFEADQVLSFWMKNTLIPLSIAYIAYDGVIIDIRDMYPNNTTSVHSSRSVRYALEVPQGWFGRVGIKVGDKITL